MRGSYPYMGSAMNSLGLVVTLAKNATLFFLVLIMINMGIDFYFALHKLYIFSPVLGLVVFLGLTLAVLIFGLWIHRILKKLPHRVEPPDPSQFGNNTVAYQRKRFHFLDHRLQGLVDHNDLKPETKTKLQNVLKTLRSKTNQPGRIADQATEHLEKAICELDRVAERRVKQSVQDVVLGVAMSPYRSLDILFVLVRNLQMAGRIIILYHQRPTLRQMARYGMDILKVVSGVHLLNYTEHFTRQLITSVPLLNSALDDIVQGIGAGILTASVGKAAIQRSRSLARWDARTESLRFEKITATIVKDVKKTVSGCFSRISNGPWSDAWSALKKGWHKAEWRLPTTGDSFFSRIQAKFKVVSNG